MIATIAAIDKKYGYIIRPILACLLVGGAAIADLVHGGRWLNQVYVNWGTGQVQNALGVLGQIIGFMITALLTGIFVAGQFLGDRLPAGVVHPFLWGKRAFVPVYTLALLLLYDLILFCFAGYEFSDAAFQPLAGLTLVAIWLMWTWRVCFEGLVDSVKALNVRGILHDLEKQAKDALMEKNLSVFWATVENVRETIRFAVEHRQSEVARLAFKTLMDVASEWTSWGMTRMKEAYPADSSQRLSEINAVLLSGCQYTLETAIENREVVVFGTSLQYVASTLPTLANNQGLYRACKEALNGLSKHYLVSSDSQFEKELLGAARMVAQQALVQSDAELFSIGKSMLWSLWHRCALDDGNRYGLLQTLTILIQQAFKVEDKQFQNELLSMYRECGLGLVRTNSTSVYEAWLLGFTAIGRTAVQEARLDSVRQLIGDITSVYETGFDHRFELLNRSLPTALIEIIKDLPLSEGTSLAFRFDHSVKLALKTGDAVALLALADLFAWVFREALKAGDLDSCERVLKIMSGYPLNTSNATDRVIAFLGESVETIIRAKTETQSDNDVLTKHKRLMASLMHSVLELLKYSFRLVDDHDLDDILRIIERLLDSGMLSPRSQLEFIGFCCRSELNSRMRKALFVKLNAYIRSVRDPAVLEDAQKKYRALAIGAIEEKDEALVRLVVSYLTSLGFGVITAKLEVGDKQTKLAGIMDTCKALNKYARDCGVSRATIVYLSTPFVQLGAVCRRRAVVEREALLGIIASAIEEVNDFATLEAATFGKKHHFKPEELRESNGGAYEEFLTDMRPAAGVSDD